MPRHIVIIGPPGSGKTTMVLRNRKTGDLIIDFDLLFQAVTGGNIFERNASLKPFVINLFSAALALPHSDALAVWIVTTSWRIAAEAVQRHSAHLVVLATPAAECVRRIHRDARRQCAHDDERLALAWWKDVGAPVITPAIAKKKIGGATPASITIKGAT